MDESPVELDTAQGYDRWAAVYDDDGNPLIAVEEPEVDRHLGDVTGLSVLDVGCGTGRHSLRLAARGARVTALDFSSGMLERARHKAGADHIRFVHHDLTTRFPLDDGRFDRVLCALVVDHIADLERFFAELGRVCNADGSIVVTVMHPAMMLRGVQARFTDPSTGRETRPRAYANQISDYILGASRAGLALLDLIERPVDAAAVERTPRAERYLGWPMLFLMHLRPAMVRR
jgi:malonyl-CoA O-methyltransferase